MPWRASSSLVARTKKVPLSFDEGTFFHKKEIQTFCLNLFKFLFIFSNTGSVNLQTIKIYVMQFVIFLIVIRVFSLV